MPLLANTVYNCSLKMAPVAGRFGRSDHERVNMTHHTEGLVDMIGFDCSV